MKRAQEVAPRHVGAAGCGFLSLRNGSLDLNSVITTRGIRLRIAEEIGLGKDPDGEDLNSSLGESPIHVLVPAAVTGGSHHQGHRMWPAEASVPRGPSDLAKQNTIHCEQGNHTDLTLLRDFFGF